MTGHSVAGSLDMFAKIIGTIGIILGVIGIVLLFFKTLGILL